VTGGSVLQPGQLETAAGSIVELCLPAEDLFLRRSRRLQHLAKNHALENYLLFLTELTRWQHDELLSSTQLPPVDNHLLLQCKTHRLPPLAPAGWPRHASWRTAVQRAIAATDSSLPQEGKTALAPLRRGDTAWMERQADLLLHNPGEKSLDVAAALFIGAALQVHWAFWARSLIGLDLGFSGHSPHCPVCGSAPVSAIVHAGGASSGLRYLQCSLCSSQWHVVRAKCSQCENTKDIEYYGLEKMYEAVRIEMCPACRSSLKVVFQEKDAAVDAVADDIASLAVDEEMTKATEHTPISINFFML